EQLRGQPRDPGRGELSARQSLLAPPMVRDRDVPGPRPGPGRVLLLAAQPPPLLTNSTLRIVLPSAGRRQGDASCCRLLALEAGFALVYECLGGLAVVVGEPGVHVVGDFEVHAFAEFACDGPVEVLLHVAVS